MELNLHAQLHCSALIIMSGLLIGVVSLPARSQEAVTIAQLLDAPSPQTDSSKVVAQNFFTALAQQNFEQAKQYFSPSLKDYGSATQLQQVWQNLLDETGALIEIEQINSTELFGNYTLLVTIRFEKSTQDFVMKLDQNQQITEVNFLQLGSIRIVAENFVDAMSQGNYALARNYLSPALKQKFLPEVLKQRWEAVLAKTGSLKQRTISTVSSSSGNDIVAMNLEFENYSGRFLLFFNPLGQIIGVSSPLTNQP
jgi:hypothetical protein